MLPTFLVQRLRWTWAVAIATMLWLNRRDAIRWIGFARRSISRRPDLEWQSWLTEARVRAALTRDPVLRADPEIDDVVVDDGVVTLRTSSTSWPGEEEFLNRFRSVKGVTDVQREPGILVGGARITSDGNQVI